MELNLRTLKMKWKKEKEKEFRKEWSCLIVQMRKKWII
jgi:hypothetical protein